MDKENKLPYSFQITPDLREKLQRTAENKGISEGEVIRKALHIYFCDIYPPKKGSYPDEYNAVLRRKEIRLVDVLRYNECETLEEFLSKLPPDPENDPTDPLHIRSVREIINNAILRYEYNKPRNPYKDLES